MIKTSSIKVLFGSVTMHNLDMAVTGGINSFAGANGALDSSDDLRDLLRRAVHGALGCVAMVVWQWSASTSPTYRCFCGPSIFCWAC